MNNRKLIRVLATLVVAAGVGGYNYLTKDKNYNESTNTTNNSQSVKSPTLASQEQTIKRIRKERDNPRSRFWLETKGKVIKVLKDDTKGSQHQKFLLKVAPDITLLVAHNLDLAKRVPITKGDSIKIRARYEWNNRGGVLHWTHHDPKGRKEGGWIYTGGKYYK